MKRKKFDEAISELLMIDEFTADCILSGIEGIEIAIERKLMEDEKMIAFSMFLSGMATEQFMQEAEDAAYDKICLN
mgnify:FL=1